jgi:CheY-like chemotaxis protein
MGGTMAVESEVGIGTTVHFCVTFGTVVHDQNENQPYGLNEGAASPKSFKLLLVEDDPTNQFVIRKMLEKDGHKCALVGDGQQALDALRVEAFDAVLMDIQLPVMNGVDATQAIRNGDAGQDKVNIPIIALTAYAMNGDREKFLAAGMDDYLAKPVRMEDLQMALARVVEK